jgi:hypothetical protein
MTANAIIFGIYCLLLGCSLVPSVKFIKALNGTGIGDHLKDVAVQVSLKVSIAIFVYLIAVIVAFANAGGKEN